MNPRHTVPSIACAAILVTTSALSAGCVMDADAPEDTTALEAAIVLPAAEEPAAEDPAAEEPAAEEPAAEDPAAVDPGVAGDAGAMLVRERSGEEAGVAGRSVILSAVQVFRNINYSGASNSLSQGIYTELGIPHDTMSSLTVAPFLTAKLYRDPRYGGPSLVLTSNTPDLRTLGFNDKTSSIAIHGPISEPGGAPHALSAVTDTEDLKFRIASDPTVIKQLASFADMLGFGWCGGTQSPYVGENFDVARNSDGSYSMQAHYNKHDPYAGGYMADKRLKITLSNFRLGIDPASFSYGPPVITSLTPIALDTALAINPNETSSEISVALDSSHTDSFSHQTDISFTQGISVAIETGAQIPFLGESSLTTEFSFSATQGWSNNTTTEDVVGTTLTYTAPVPGFSKKLITMMGFRTRSDISYSATSYVSFDVSFHGFLRWEGNARSDHPSNRPFVTVKFGSDSLSGLDDILDQYDHSYIDGYSDWDWHWIKAYGRSTLGSTMGFFRRGITVPLSGRFTGVMGTNVTFNEGLAQPL